MKMRQRRRLARRKKGTWTWQERGALSELLKIFRGLHKLTRRKPIPRTEGETIIWRPRPYL